MEKDIAGLITEIGQIRNDMIDVVDKIDIEKIIYPGWTVKEIIGHIIAWEIAIDKALIAYQKNDPPYFLHEQDFDIFNEEAVAYRASWTLEQVFQEWKEVRAALLKTIKKLKEEDLEVEMVLPWGSERTVAELIEIAGEHESEHMVDTERVAG
jgi:hypothetical protein